METLAWRATVALTQAQYDALSTKDINVQYLITDAEYLKIEYSVNGTDWTTTATDALYMRTSTDNGVTWSEAISVKGADGDMTGPASAVDGNFAAFDGITGATLKDSGKKASDFLESVAEDITPELGGPLDCNNELVYWDIYSISGTAIDVANGNKQKLTLSTTNIIVTLETPSGACAFHLFIYQGATARTITWPTIKWLGGTAPNLAVSNGRFVVCLAWDGASWFGSWGAYS